MFRRIKAPAFRRAMAGGTVSIAVLFLLRLFRYALTPYETDLERWLWYAYYLPLGALPVFFYLAGRSLYEEDPERLGKDAEGRAVRWSLLIMWGALSVMYLTNDIHRLVFDSAGGIPDSGTFVGSSALAESGQGTFTGSAAAYQRRSGERSDL